MCFHHIDLASIIQEIASKLSIKIGIMKTPKAYIKPIFFFLVVGIIHYNSNAQIRDENEINEIAELFIEKEIKSITYKHSKSKSLISSKEEISLGSLHSIYNSKHDLVAFIQKLNPKGYIIISANASFKPILGFSLNSEIDPLLFKKSPLYDILESYYYEKSKKNLSPSLKNSTSSTAEQWGPLLQTTWNQGDHYNDYCPYVTKISSAFGRRPVGCVSTSFSQLLNYWQYPQRIYFSEDDFIKISDELFTLPDAEEWGAPSIVTLNSELSNIVYNGNKEEEAFLSYGIGVKLHMNYGPSSSGAFMHNTIRALNNDLGFGSAVIYSHVDGVWNSHVSAIIDDIKLGRPVQLAVKKSDKKGGHSIILDGWRDDGFFHLNYGWGSNSPDNISEAWYTIPIDMPHYDMVQTVIYRISKYLGWGQYGSNLRNDFNTVYAMPVNAPERKWIVNLPNELSDDYSFTHFVIGAGGKIYASISPHSLNSTYHPHLAIFDKYGSLEKLIEISESNRSVSYLSQNSKGEIIFAATKGYDHTKIYKYNTFTKRITPIFTHDSPDAGYSDMPIKIDGDDNIYFIIQPRYTSNSATFYCIDKNGNKRWSYNFPSSAEFHISASAIDETNEIACINYFNQTETYKGMSHLICFNKNDGSILFDKELPTSSHYASKMISAPSIGKTNNILLDADDILFSLNSTNGNIIWQREFKWRGSNSTPTLGTKGQLYVNYDDKLMSLNPSDGSTIWEKSYSLGSSDYMGEIYSSNNEMVIVSYELNDEYRLEAIKDNGSSYSSKWERAGGWNIAFGPGNSLYVMPSRNESSIWCLSDFGERGDPEGLGMDYVNNTPPTIPIISFPIDRSENQDTTNLQISWNASDPDGHELKYEVFLCAMKEEEDVVFEPIASGLSETSYTINELESGTNYSVAVLASDGQTKSENSIISFTTKIDESTVIEQLKTNPRGYIVVKPNPAKDVVNISLENFDNEEYTLSLVDLTGKTLFSKTINIDNKNLNQNLNISSIQQGCYLIRLKSSQKTLVEKLAIVK
jgi:hypothetical protein